MLIEQVADEEERVEAAHAKARNRWSSRMTDPVDDECAAMELDDDEPPSTKKKRKKHDDDGAREKKRKEKRHVPEPEEEEDEPPANVAPKKKKRARSPEPAAAAAAVSSPPRPKKKRATPPPPPPASGDPELDDLFAPVPPAARPSVDHPHDPVAEARAEVPACDPYSIPMRTLNWDEYEEDPNDPIIDKKWCFWCHYAQSKEEYAGNKNIEKLVLYHNEHRSFVDPFEFARHMQGLYNLYVREYMIDPLGKRVNGKKPRKRGPPWPGRTVYEHAKVHAMLPLAIYEDILRYYVTTVDTVANQLRVFDPATNDETVRAKMVDHFIKLTKEVRPFIKEVSAARNTNLYGLR
jgi:hypothetical protein